MIFTGKNLELVRRCIGQTRRNIQNHITICPNTFEYATRLDQLEEERAQLDRMLNRIDDALKKKD